MSAAIVEEKSSVKLVSDKPKVWGQISQPAAICSLEDVMSEQLAKEIQDKETDLIYREFQGSKKTPGGENDAATATNVQDNDASGFLTEQEHNDFLIAQMLQLECDKEFDEFIKGTENNHNRNSKVKLSYDKFKSVHPVYDKEAKEQRIQDLMDLTSESESEDEITKINFSKGGIWGKGDQMISKHDLPLTQRHNACRVMYFPPDFPTGDSHGFDMRLPNKVYNQLKVHSEKNQASRVRLSDKNDKSTSLMSLDAKTKLLLFKLVNADVLDSLGGVVSTGKEAVILYARGGNTQEITVPQDCVAKVFKTTLNEFKTREKYIADDYRFKNRFNHLNPQKIVRLWAEKEMHNLMKMRKAEIRCPDVVVLKKHILIMSLIGTDQKPAPKLLNAQLDQTQLKSAYEQCIQLMKDLYQKCNLVHADLNQFNLLWHENQVWVVDVSQSVETIHPMGLEFLLRDCNNLVKFFTNRKLDGVSTAEEIFMDVTGMNFSGTGQEFLAQIQRYVKDKRVELNLASNQDDTYLYNFDYYFEKSLREKSTSESSGGEPNSEEQTN